MGNLLAAVSKNTGHSNLDWPSLDDIIWRANKIPNMLSASYKAEW